MSQIALIVKLTTADGKRAEAVDHLAKLVDAAASEPGTLDYVMMTDSADPNVVWFHEVYADKAAFDAHSSSEAMGEVMAAVGGLLGAAPEFNMVEIVRRKGAPAA
jgi:quinol monooxygenase YgiN